MGLNKEEDTGDCNISLISIFTVIKNSINHSGNKLIPFGLSDKRKALKVDKSQIRRLKFRIGYFYYRLYKLVVLDTNAMYSIIGLCITPLAFITYCSWFIHTTFPLLVF